MRCNVEGRSMPAQFECPMWSAQDARLVGLQRASAHTHRSFQPPLQGTGEKTQTQLLATDRGAIFRYLPPKLNIVTCPAKWSPSGGCCSKKSCVLSCVGFALEWADRSIPPRDNSGFRAPGALSHHLTNHSRCYSTHKSSFIQSTKVTAVLWPHPTEAWREAFISPNSWCLLCLN